MLTLVDGYIISKLTTPYTIVTWSLLPKQRKYFGFLLYLIESVQIVVTSVCDSLGLWLQLCVVYGMWSCESVFKWSVSWPWCRLHLQTYKQMYLARISNFTISVYNYSRLALSIAICAIGETVFYLAKEN